MPESGEIQRLGRDCVRVWFTYWQGHPPVLSMSSTLCDARHFEGIPDGAIVDMDALRRGEVVVSRLPVEPIALDDETFEALLQEAERSA